jgi:hypothetical protein
MVHCYRLCFGGLYFVLLLLLQILLLQIEINGSIKT